MNKSLRNLTQVRQPESTESTIRQALKTKGKDSKVWIVAEGDDDADLYGRMYDNYFVQVLPSANENGNKSCKNVELIVFKILKDGFVKIIGIRDKDYTPFTGYSKPQNIFLTDRRDIEMQIIEVKQSEITPHITSQSLKDVFIFAEQVGRYRIFNDQENLRFCFDDIKVDCYWDFTKKCLKKGWCTSLENFFFNHITSTVGVTNLKQKYSSLAVRLNSASYSVYDICQGHEVVNLLKRMCTNNFFDHLEKDLFEWYRESDYVSTQLAIDIQNWANSNDCRM